MIKFNFFRREKEEPIYLDCYTASHFAYNFAKIDHAQKYFPDWWLKENKVTPNGVSTIKHCSAFIDSYTKGIVLPLWGEVEIIVNALGDETPYTWRSSNEDFDLHSNCHSKAQWSGFGNDNLYNIKFVSPWVFKTNDLVYFAWSQPTWSQPDTFNSLTGLPGVVQYKTQSFTAINYVVEQKEESQTINLPSLTPMAILHPMTEREVVIRTHLVDENKMRKLLRRGGGMLLNSTNDHALDRKTRLKTRKKKFWDKADKINKGPFK